MQKVSLRAFVCSYLNHLAVTGYSPRTIKDKDFCLNKFTEWCEARGIVAVTSIRKETVEKYQKHLYHYHSEVTDKPATPEMGPVAAFLPGSGVAQLGPTGFGKYLILGRGARL